MFGINYCVYKHYSYTFGFKVHTETYLYTGTDVSARTVLTKTRQFMRNRVMSKSNLVYCLNTHQEVNSSYLNFMITPVELS